MNKPQAILVAAFLALPIAACGSSTSSPGTHADSGSSSDTGGATGTGTGTGDDSGTTTDDSGTTTDSATTPPADAAGETSSADNACMASTSMAECQKCCATNHTTAYQAFVTTLLTCACKPGNCDTQCAATACAATPATPDAACATCLKGVQGGACKADLTAACTGSGACVPFTTCVASECAGKT